MTTLYGYFRSSAAYRVRIALNLKGLAYDQAPIDLVAGEQRGEAYLADNPQGLVPTLVTDDGLRLTQSLAICEYLEEVHPEPALLPEAPPSAPGYAPWPSWWPARCTRRTTCGCSGT